MKQQWVGQACFSNDDSESWRERALCAQTDPDSFFPEKGSSSTAAKRVCHSCAVRSECLDHALLHDERFGVWGGMSAYERLQRGGRTADGGS